MPRYIKVPYPAAFYQKGIIDNFPGFITHFESNSYSSETITRLLADITAAKDLGRTHLKFGENGAPVLLVEQGVTLSQQQIFAKVIQVAGAHQIKLSLAEVRALFAFSISINGDALQGGYFKMTEMPVMLLFNRLNCQPMRDGPGLNSMLQVKKSGDELVVVNNYHTKNIYKYPTSDQQLIKKKESFSISENNGLFTITFQKDSDDDFLIEKIFWEKRLLPAAFHVLKDSKQLTPADCFVLIPFLINPTFRKAFAVKLNKQAKAVQRMTLGYVDICFSNDPPLKEVVLNEELIKKLLPALNKKSSKSKLSFPTINWNIRRKKSVDVTPATELFIDLPDDVPRPVAVVPECKTPVTALHAPVPKTLVVAEVKHVTPAIKFEMAKQELNELLNSFDDEAFQKIQGNALIAAIAQLSDEQKNTNLFLLTDILQHTKTIIQSPADEANLKLFQDDMKRLNNKGWRNLCIGLGIILLGSVLLAITTLISLALLGVATSWVVGAGVTVLNKSIAIVTGVCSFALMGAGLAVTSDQPLKQVSRAAASFFQSVRANQECIPIVLEQNLSKSVMNK
jgi:hypothetical protein